MIDPTHYDSNLEPEEAARVAARPRASPTQNRLVVIGWLGIKRAYLNMTREEAMARCRQEMDLDEPVDPSFVKEFEFTDTFNVYDAWGD